MYIHTYIHTCISKERRAYVHKDYVEYLSEHEAEGGAGAGISRLKQHLTLVKEQHRVVDLGLTEQEPQQFLDTVHISHTHNHHCNFKDMSSTGTTLIHWSL